MSSKMKRRILFIDADANRRFEMQQAFSSCIVAEDLGRAIVLLKEAHFDIICIGEIEGASEIAKLVINTFKVIRRIYIHDTDFERAAVTRTILVSAGYPVFWLRYDQLITFVNL